MDGLEHKDQRLHAVEGADWRDKLGDLRRNLTGDFPRDDDDDTTEGGAGSGVG